MEYDKNIPIPDGTMSRRATLEAMGVGDSFLITKSIKSWRSVASGLALEGYQFVTRTVDGGWRIWRRA